MGAGQEIRKGSKTIVPSEKELFVAVESGAASVFASLSPADLAAALSLRNEDDHSLFHVAAASGHTKASAAASRCGGRRLASIVNGKDEEGWAPIHSVASSGNAEIVDILLEHGMRPCPCIAPGNVCS
ncbi:protein phosphatase 1 regulatory subunit 16A-like [Hordeum vulgare subsp. vulgare]|uniref:protein phosphatase 1 regulatory subunit 16A-like n=1 Tax=Hordeum vulgare subsp. vulgare TaxID=112509 RepID=UPI001D1A4663|nr:protein phosphatase 1 regulatory subunit 16A-like [Hordeum vulgare subsp. vulgare]